MTVTAISLMDPVSGLTVAIMPRDGVSAQQIDPSAPARAVTESRVGARGSVDSTKNLDAGTLALSVLLWPGITTSQTPEAFMDEIAPLLDPAMRPALVVTNDAWAGPRRAILRYDSTAKPWSDPTQWPVQFNWVVPDACWEDAALTQVVINAFVTSTTGLAVGATGLRVTSAGVIMPPTSGAAPSQVVSPGKTSSHWQAALYGPCTGPKFANDVLGLALEFTDALQLQAGDYVLLDSQAESALKNGSSDVTGALNFTTSTWWLMQQGLNIIRYYPTTADAGSQAVLTFRGAYPL